MASHKQSLQARFITTETVTSGTLYTFYQVCVCVCVTLNLYIAVMILVSLDGLTTEPIHFF